MKTTSIQIINLKNKPEHYKEFKKNIKITLQKIGSSNKTKALHKLIENDLLFIGIGSIDTSKTKVAKFGTYSLRGTKLGGLTANLTEAVEESDRKQIAIDIKDLTISNQELSRAKVTITDVTDINIKRIEKEQRQLITSILDAIDYFTLIDIYFYLYIEMLTEIGQRGKGSNKLFEATHKLIFIALVKVINRYSKKALEDKEKIDKLQIIFDYLFAQHFTKASSQSTISALIKMYSDEKVQFLKDLKPSQYKDLNDLGTLLTKSHIINITTSIIMRGFEEFVGSDIETILKGDMDELISYLISTQYKSTIFDSKIIDTDAQKRLEELVLNFKRDITLG